MVGSEAGKCSEILGTWIGERREAKNLREVLAKRKSDIKRALVQSETSEQLENLEALEERMRLFAVLDDVWAAKHAYTRHQELTAGRRKAREQLGDGLKAVQYCQQVIAELISPSQELMEDLRRRAGQVLWRFSLVEGILPLGLKQVESRDGETVRRSYAIRTGDGRLFQHLSTGQMAQVAVSLLTAQNLAVSHYLNHRMILLDDVTTAYDLSNLTREAILWRQIAYGTTETLHKRQIFISSHHEDMTNHLLDLLVPPPGRSMRLINLIGWSNETGPGFDSFAVEPSTDVDKASLAKTLGEF